MTPIRIFISSVQKEFADERAALRDYLRGDALMRRFFEVFLFEDVPAADRRADELYLAEVRHCDLYVGLFGNDYGFEDAEGVSPTEREFGATLWRDWLTDRAITSLGLTDRQRAALPHLKLQRRITNAEYRGITGVTERTAGRDLEDLVNKGVLERTARTGRGAGYRVVTKPDINPTNPT